MHSNEYPVIMHFILFQQIYAVAADSTIREGEQGVYRESRSGRDRRQQKQLRQEGSHAPPRNHTNNNNNCNNNNTSTTMDTGQVWWHFLFI